MNIKLNEKIKTNLSEAEILALLQSEFTQMSTAVHTDGGTVTARLIVPNTFGAINRQDVTHISLSPSADGFIVTADITIAPSTAFWFFFIFGLLFAWVLWIPVVIFYMMQKSTIIDAVRQALGNCRVRCDAPSAAPQHSAPSALDEIEKLGSLKEKGLLTEEEFTVRKAHILKI